MHKLRNILSKIRNKAKNRRRIEPQASRIFKSKTKEEAIVGYNKFIKDWAQEEPAVVRTMEKDIEYYFTYFNFPQDKRSFLKSTNPLERINRELRKITRRLGYFQSQRSLDIFIYLTLKEEGFIIEGDFSVRNPLDGDMPGIKQKNALLEFAKNS